MALGKRIRQEREARGWTLERLSEASEVDIGTISALEVRDSQRSKYSRQIARAFGLTVEQLEMGNDAPARAVNEMPRHRVEAPPPPTYKTPRAPMQPWPFAAISPDEWRSLSAAQHAEVQGYIRALLGPSRKRQVA